MALTVLVSGVAGLIGSHLAADLIVAGHSVRAIDNLMSGYPDVVPSGARLKVADCREPASYSEVLKDVDVVYHCAAAPYEGISVFSPFFVHEHTCSATIALLSASVSAGVGRFVMCSSMARYGTGSRPFTEDMNPAPVDPYGIAKVSAESVIQAMSVAHGIEFNIAVPHNVIGPHQRYDDPYRNVAAIMINRMLRGLQPIIYGDGSQRRCFSFIADVVPCLRALGARSDVVGEIVNVGPDEEPVSILGLAELISEIVGMALDPIFVEARPMEVHTATCSSTKARDLLGYRTTTSLREGLVSMVNWIANRGPCEFDYHLPLEIVTDSTPKTWTDRLL